MTKADGPDGPAPRWHTVAALGTAQTFAWASTHDLPAILAASMARELRVTLPTVFAAFSLALIASAVLGPSAGRAIDHWGGRLALITSALIFAAGLLMLATAHSSVGLFAAWAVLGVRMGSGLYESAFSTLVRFSGRSAHGAISGVTLFAGFASTVGSPLSTLQAHVGWRGACLAGRCCTWSPYFVG